MTNHERTIVSRLRAMQGWVICLFPYGLNIELLNSNMALTVRSIAPLQSILGTCADLIVMIEEEERHGHRQRRLRRRRNEQATEIR